MGFRVQAFDLLPLEMDICLECLTKHPPNTPHNKDSLYYHCTFYAAYGRWPTWVDAVAHCNRGNLFDGHLKVWP